MDVARAGNTIYLAGYFTRVGPITGGGVPLDRQLGQPADPFPRVAGAVAGLSSSARTGLGLISSSGKNASGGPDA